MQTIVYQIKDAVYVNLTNRCPCACTFCLRTKAPGVYGSPSLWLEREPSAGEVQEALGAQDWTRSREVVFCGYGEPTERLDVLLEVAGSLKARAPSLRVRVNTNGLSDLVNGRLRYCNAGHNPPMILADKATKLPVVSNLPLGILPGFKYAGQEAGLRADDAIFLYTDGLTEAENRANEQFGEARVEDALRGSMGSEEHLAQVRKRVEAFVGKAPQSDDLTMLVIRYLGTEKGNHLTLTNDIKQISLLSGFIDRVAEENDLDPGLAMSLNLAIEEAVTNVIMYAYPEGTEGKIDLQASTEGRCLQFILSDSGKSFDPTAVPDADISASLQERHIGGLGIHLVRNIMDSVSYRRNNGKNILTMTKNI